MAKGHPRATRRLALPGLMIFLLIPILYTLILRRGAHSLHPLKSQVSPRESSLSLRSDGKSKKERGSSLSLTVEEDGAAVEEFNKFLTHKLARGEAQSELSQNGISCTSDRSSDVCITSAAVRIATSASSSSHSLSAVYLVGNQQLPRNSDIIFRPYPRKFDPEAMQETSPIQIVGGHPNPPPCDITHPLPAVIFSTGGFAGNFFHDINDLIIPLFLTTGHLRSRIRLVATDFRPWWAHKYRRVLSRLAADEIIAASSAFADVGPAKVHCFPAAIVGLKYHGNLACNVSDAPSGISVQKFRRFLHEALSLKADRVVRAEEPTVVLISRRNSRALLNEDEIIETAREIGFRVEIAAPKRMWKMESFAELVNGCGVLMGVHGAGLTNMVFLPPGAVLLQVVPWGLDWASEVYYGQPAQQMGLQYVEYHIEVQESTLYDKYPGDHPILADPWSINNQGYNVSKPVYVDGQNLRLNLTRFRETLLLAFQLLPRPS
ncbi:uncharacterized protein LOC109716148 [Ananas comosus]|uniref:Uncharacterized protein LOC109716148 n=1 Tax=Ananas comosus TaxID=4615 RepID=A0A6P5FM85_ANACO|nr:uncharacterized protein LOC109716148 [Ananas comosus]